MIVFLVLVAEARTIHIGLGDDLWGAIATAEPGDEIVVAAGTWSTKQSSGSWLRKVTLKGVAGSPIVIRGEDGARPVIEGDPAGSQNIVNIGGEHYVWKGFEMRYGSHGLRVETSAHALFEDLEIHDVGDVGLSMNITNNTYDDITVRHVQIHHTAGDAGECLYLGCNSDMCQVTNSVIEWNWCHDTMAAGQGDGIELKTGSSGNIIRHNVIHDVKYPGITLYGTRGRGSNEVYGNVIWNSADNGIQVVGDAYVHDNLVINSGANGIASKPSQDEVPKDLVISHNTVIGAGDACLRGNDWKSASGTSGVVVANNALFCADTNAILMPGGRTATFSQNAVQGFDDYGSNNFDGDITRDLTDPAALALYPKSGSALIDAADAAYPSTEDFDCRPRTGAADVGAYETKKKPSWAIVASFKSCPTPEDTDTDNDTDPDTDTDRVDDTGPFGDTTDDDVGLVCGCGTGGFAGLGALGLLPLFLLRRSRPRFA